MSSSLPERPAILALVEDPGAANMVAPLPGLLAGRAELHLHALGAAQPQLDALGCPWTPPPVSDPAALIAARPWQRVVVGTAEEADALGLALIAAARAAGSPTLGLVDAAANAAFRFRGRGDHALAFAPDLIAVPDPGTARAYVALGHPEEAVHVIGHPQFSHVRDRTRALSREGRAAVRARIFPDLPAERPLMVFLAERDDGLEPARLRRGPDYRLTGWGGTDARCRIVLESVLDALALALPEALRVLRLHPKTPAADFAPYRPHLDAISQGGDALEVCFAADLVVGLTTTLLLEAALLGPGVVSVVPRPEEAAWLGPGAAFLPVLSDPGPLPEALAQAAATAHTPRSVTSAAEAHLPALDRSRLLGLLGVEAFSHIFAARVPHTVLL